jgi:hypothetical protein
MLIFDNQIGELFVNSDFVKIWHPAIVLQVWRYDVWIFWLIRLLAAYNIVFFLRLLLPLALSGLTLLPVSTLTLSGSRLRSRNDFPF